MHKRNAFLPLTLLMSIGLTACSTPLFRDDNATGASSADTAPPTAAAEEDPFDTIEKAGVSAFKHEGVGRQSGPESAAPPDSTTGAAPEAGAESAVQPGITQSGFEAEATSGQTPAESATPVATHVPPPRLIWDRFRESFTFPACQPGSDAHDWATWYGGRQDYMDRVLRRAEPWLHDIANEIEARQLPLDLILLPVVESAYDPFATSRGRAVGTWQFVSGTAGDFGLSINDWYDGRRDVYAATRAALDYLRFLFDRFNNDWRLALAAYNGGHNRVQRALRRYNGNASQPRPNDLRLPRETRSYAPKLHGLSCLFREPERFGLKLPDLMDEPRIDVVNVGGPLDLIIAARLAQLDIAELYALNPGFSRWATPPDGPHHLVLPQSHVETFRQALDTLPEEQRVRWHGVVVRSGDTLSAIAARTGVSVAELMAANGMQSTLIRPGQELRILGGEKSAADPDYEKQLAALQKLQGRLLPGEVLEHKVRSGESLWIIARKYGVSVKELARWNGISNTRRIHPGQRLRVGTGKRSASGVVVTANSKPSEHQVRRGDSPWTIARRYRIKLKDLLRWNDLDTDSILRPGQTLRLRPASGQG